MSETQAHPESEEEYEDRRRELITDAAQTKQELEAKQNEALEEIAEGEQLERYETISLGNLELEVKGWLPGGVEDKATRAMELAESEDPAKFKESKETMLPALAEMTAGEQYDVGFWQEYANRYGQEGVLIAVQKVMAPAQENLEDRQEALDGFRTGTEGARPRTRGGNGGSDAR